MADKKKNAHKSAPMKEGKPTTGHVWDGIEEFDNPLPRWWLWIFYGTIIWALVYTILYPAWPLVNRATAGILGYSSRAALVQEKQRFEERNAEWFQSLNETELALIRQDPELFRFAVNAGGAVFRAHCSQCHGTGGAGVQAKGFPNLVDDDWLWGGTVEDIHQTILYGIRNEEFPDARWSQMPAFGRDGILSDEEIDQVVEYVLALSRQPHDATLARLGQEVYAINCAGCHGLEGEGDRVQGAPRLNDAVWLYGGTREAIRTSVVNARFGIMPGFANRLREAEIRAVAVYVHQLGGGE